MYPGLSVVPACVLVESFPCCSGDGILVLQHPLLRGRIMDARLRKWVVRHNYLSLSPLK